MGVAGRKRARAAKNRPGAFQDFTAEADQGLPLESRH